MKLVPFDCTNPKTNDEVTIYVNPNQVAFVSGGELPSEIVSFPGGESVSTEAAIIMLQNGMSFTVKDTMDNVVSRLAKEK